MLVTVLGPPSRFAIWAIPAIRSIARTSIGPFDFIHLSTVDRFRDDWKNRRTEHVMLFSDSPDAEIAKILSKNLGPTIFLREDPFSVALHCHRYASQEPIAAARIASVSFATLHDIVLTCENLMMISHCKSPKVFVRHISDFLALPLTDDQIGLVLKEIGRPDAIDPPQISFQEKKKGDLIDQEKEGGSPIEKMDLDFALVAPLEPFASIFQAQAADRFTWPRSIFFSVDRKGAPLNTPLDAEIDLTGPARVLFYGPYFHLPLGAWKATVRFHVSGNQSGNELLVEVISGLQVISRATSRLPAQGTYQFTIHFAVMEPRDPIQLRASTLRGAIEGTFSLHEAMIARSKDGGEAAGLS